jgi:hypothetical protein
MESRDPVCVCDHPQSSHKNIRVFRLETEPDSTKTECVWGQCKGFQSSEITRSTATSRLNENCAEFLCPCTPTGAQLLRSWRKPLRRLREL